MKLFHFDVKVGNWRVLTNTHDIADGAVTFDKIGNGAVTGPKIQDGAVGWKKLSPDLQNIIASAGEHGVALSNEFGDSELLGISQKTLTETIDAIQDRINQLHPGSYLSITATPNLIYKGETSEIDVTVRMKDGSIADKITLMAGNEEVASEENVSQIEATISVQDTTNLTGLAERQGLTFDASTVVTGVKPYYVGSIDSNESPQDMLTDEYRQPIKANPNGTYNITVPANGYKVYFILPDDMEIHKATMSGFDFPLEYDPYFPVDGYTMHLYASANTYDAGSLTIVIS